MIVVATDNFEVYHDVVSELRDRGVTFTTIEPGAELPAETTVVVTSDDDDVAIPDDLEHVSAVPQGARTAVEEAVALLRGGRGRTVVGIDPGEMPGIAVLSGGVVVATFQVPPDEVASVVHEEIAEAPNPVVRIGDGARLIGARIVDDLDDVPVELVDETGTTPYLGRGTRGISDVIAAINIARLDGDRIDEREVEPTSGELQRIRERSREQSEENRAIDGGLARRVATGELTIDEALAEHRGSGE